MFYHDGRGCAMWSSFAGLSSRWSTGQGVMWNAYLNGLLPVDLENMPEEPESDTHAGMRPSLSPQSPSATASTHLARAPSPRAVLCPPEKSSLTNGEAHTAKEALPLNGIISQPPRSSPGSNHGEEEKIQEYLQRSDTAVIYPEPVDNRIKQENSATETEDKAEKTTDTPHSEEERSKTVHSSNSDYLLKCPHCDRIFSSPEAIKDLKDHLADFHKETQTVVPASTPRPSENVKNAHSCTKCNATFADKDSLAKHKLFHAANGQGSTTGSTDDSSALRKFKCPECGKAFKFKHHLKEHIRIHSGEKPFACQNCGKRFSHSGSYSSHMTSKKCLVVNLKVRKVDTRSPRGRGSSQNNSFRPIIPKYGNHNTPTGSNELPLVPAGYMPSSERFSTFLSPNRPPQSYVPLTFHPLLTSTSPYLPMGNFPEVTHLLQHRLENEASTTAEQRAHSHPHSQMPPLSIEEKFEDFSEASPSSHRGLNAVNVKKILEIVDATVKQQNQQSQPTQPVPEKTRNGLLSELLSAGPQTVNKTLSCGEVQPFDSHCRFCSRTFDNMIDLHQHERYLCSLNSDLRHSRPQDSRDNNNSDGESSKASSEEGRPRSSSSILNGENLLTLKTHYQSNPRPKKSEMIRLSRDLKCPTRTIQAWFYSQQHSPKDQINGDSPRSPSFLHPVPSSPFSSTTPHYNGALNTSAALIPYRSSPAPESSQEVHSSYSQPETDNDQPLDLSIKSKRDSSPIIRSSPPALVESEVLNLSQKSSRVATPPKENSHYLLHRPQINQIQVYQTGVTSPQPSVQSSLLYKYMQMGLSASMRSPEHENSLNPPLAAVTPTSPERSPSHAEDPRTLPSPDAASCADNCSSPSGTVGSYGHVDENNDTDFSPSGGKKLRIWNQGEGDESTLDDSPGPEEDSSGSGKIRKSWKVHKVESEEGMYACDQCDKMFSKQSSLARHKYEHSGQRPHKCDVCSKAFKHKHHLTEHKRLHSGEKPFQCKKCLKRFSHSGSYSQHMNHRYSYCKPYHE